MAFDHEDHGFRPFAHRPSGYTEWRDYARALLGAVIAAALIGWLIGWLFGWPAAESIKARRTLRH